MFLTSKKSLSSVDFFYNINNKKLAVAHIEKKLAKNKTFTVKTDKNIQVFLYKNFVKKKSKEIFIKNFINKLKFILLNATQDGKSLKYLKFFYVGLGYKMFVRLGRLYVWVGLTHYTILDIPRHVKILAKKKRIYVTSSVTCSLSSVSSSVRYMRKRDIYKGKGILEVKTYKGLIRMKTGKKKQF